MRILFVHNRYKNLGGEDLTVKAEIQLMQQHGHTTDLFQVDNTRISGIAEKASAALGTVCSLTSRRALSARIQSFKPDLAHVHNFFPLLSPSVFHACQEVDVPVVNTLHNFRLICPNALLLREGRICEDCVGRAIAWPAVLHGCYRNSRVGSAVVAAMLATHKFLRTWHSAVDAYIARSNFSRDKLIEGGLPSEKISTIPSFAPDPGEPADSNGLFAFFAGRLSPEKGIATLLSAWDRIRSSSLCLKLAGDGPLKDEVLRRADGKRVQYLGLLSRDKVQELMCQASVLIFPSICYENFPLSIVEAFASGLPVIASGMGAAAEIIDDGRTGLHFLPGNAEDLTAKIEWLISRPQEITRMRGEARAEYLSKYTPERNYELTAQLYGQVIDARCSSSVA